MPVPSTTVRAIVTRWANERGITIPHGTTFHDADALDAFSLCDATQGWSLRRLELDSIKDFITRQAPPVLTMRERMHITLGPASRQAMFSTEIGTTVPATQTRTPTQVELWTLDDLPVIPSDLWAATPTETESTIHIFSKQGCNRCTCEGDICSGFSRVLNHVCECIGSQQYAATGSKADTIGLPDLLVWRSHTTLALVVECMTPWEFEAGADTRLDDIYNAYEKHHATWATMNSDNSGECPPELAFPRQVFRAIGQLYGYMAVNRRRYGVLTTFSTTFLFKRDDNDTLFISKGIAADQLEPVTLLEAIARLLLKDNTPRQENITEANNDPFAQEMAQPSNSVGKPTKKVPTTPRQRTANDTDAPSYQDEREVVLITNHPHHRVIASGDSASIVATALDGVPVAIKAVDTCKKPALLDALFRERDAYVALQAVQGDCIPILVRPAPVVLWEGILDGLVLSLIKGQTLEEMGDDGIAAIPLECRLQAVRDLREIHSLGVLHGAMARRHLIWRQDDCRPRLVFVAFGHAVTSCDVDDDQFDWEEDDLCDILQLDDIDSNASSDEDEQRID